MLTNIRDPETVIHRPKCSVCGKKMMLARRVPAPALGPGVEFRSFECPGCGYTMMEKAIVPPSD